MEKTVTLITGDVVAVNGERRVVSIQPAAGREDMTFSVRTSGDQTYVVPTDAAGPLAAGTVDARLFDVAGLIEARYDDANRDDLPVIVTYADQRPATRAAVTSAGAEIVRTLPSIGGDAVQVAHDDSAAFWSAVTAELGTDSVARAAAAGVEKIWLDGRVEASLDRSVPQIGAPAAWDAGYDGTGVTVAVLDTGIDATHPDLRDRVAAQENFSEAGDAADHLGHGTHVASTIAGSGAQSGGRHVGVAPGTRLLNGKVLDDEGSGTDSGVIAGMQWAVDQGADVVSMSLGGPDTSDVDPVEEAVNTLSAQSGVLFVIAGGNFGPEQGTIDSPGSAAAALTVGAVDRSDAIAEFSGRGPVAGGALKPDVTAPGVDIVAARAAGTELGEPAGDGYIALSGTSMATPHVAGAAALLAQQHPDWTGDQLKAVLTTSATPAPGTPISAQGTGRIDVARAIAQSVTVSGSADFGVQEFPHDDDQPVVRELTYRHDGDEPIVLDLSVDVSGPGGATAPDGMFTIEPAQITVPAAGEVVVTATVDTRVEAADGLYDGVVTAAVGDETVARTAIGVVRETPHHDLTLRFLDSQGRPVVDAYAAISSFGAYEMYFAEADENGEATIRVAADTYLIDAQISDDGGDTVLTAPTYEVSADSTLVLDAREAKPFDVEFPHDDLTGEWGKVDYGVTHGESWRGTFFILDALDNLRTGRLGPDPVDGEMTTDVSGGWARPTDVAAERYLGSWHGDETLLDGLTDTVEPDELATVDLSVGSTSEGAAGSLNSSLIEEGSYWLAPAGITIPYTGVTHVFGQADWVFTFWQGREFDQNGWVIPETGLETRTQTYEAGKTYDEQFNVGVFGPSLVSTFDEFVGASRTGDELFVHVPTFGDGSGHPGSSDVTAAHTSLRVDGDEVFAVDEEPRYFTQAVPAGAGDYVLTTDVARDPAVSSVSTRVRATWGFHSDGAGAGESETLPLSAVRFSPKLSSTSTAPAGERFTVPFVVEGAAAEVGVDELAVDVSYDDGATWRPAPVRRGQVSLKHPDAAGSVSLRVTLTDAEGNTLEQTIDRAYLIE